MTLSTLKRKVREIVIGHSQQDRLLLVCFTERAGVIRLISARKATKKERKDYEKTHSGKKKKSASGNMLPEYHFDYHQARPTDLQRISNQVAGWFSSMRTWRGSLRARKPLIRSSGPY
jgi:hypothetical protein